MHFLRADRRKTHTVSISEMFDLIGPNPFLFEALLQI